MLGKEFFLESIRIQKELCEGKFCGECGKRLAVSIGTKGPLYCKNESCGFCDLHVTSLSIDSARSMRDVIVKAITREDEGVPKNGHRYADTELEDSKDDGTEGE